MAGIDTHSAVAARCIDNRLAALRAHTRVPTRVSLASSIDTLPAGLLECIVAIRDELILSHLLTHSFEFHSGVAAK